MTCTEYQRRRLKAARKLRVAFLAVAFLEIFVIRQQKMREFEEWMLEHPEAS
jgi:hypothetical protein